MRGPLLWAGAASPLIAIGCLLLATALYPGFDSATRYISELGTGGRGWPTFLFNLSLVAVAVGGATAGGGFLLAIPALGGGRLAASVVAGCFFAAAVGLICGIVFVYPNPWHNLIQLGLGIQIAPIALLFAIWRMNGLIQLRRVLIVSLLAMLALTVVTKHLLWTELVNSANVGWWERGYAVILVCWGALAALLIERRLTQQSRAA